MKVLEMNHPIYFDVDGTLVRDARPGERVTATIVLHPHRSNGPVYKVKMHANIQLLKDMHARGRTIIVWSQAGWEWAAAVVDGLKLAPYVHYAAEKPIAYIDDLESSQFMGQRIFLND